MKPKKVILLTNTYPPIGGIGGRRWVKFIKYLSPKNDFFVFCTSAIQKKSRSSWTHDLINLHKIKYIKSFYPKYLSKTPISFFDKFMYRISLLFLKFFTKGNYYDRSVLFNDEINKLLERKILEGYHNVVVTMPPFQLSYHILKTLYKYPFVKLILDFRDPWTTNKTSYSYDQISSERLAYEKEIEKEVLARSNVIISVLDEMSFYFKSINTNSTSIYKTIANGFDPEDFVNLLQVNQPSNELCFIFAGSMYEGTEKYLKALANALLNIKNKNPEIYKRFKFDFYGSAPHFFKKYEKACPIIKHHGEIPLSKMHVEIKKANVCMLLLSDHLDYSFSTKFYEYIALNKPIAVLGREGKTSAMILKHKLGYLLDPENIEKQLIQIMDQFISGDIVQTNHFDTSSYAIPVLAKEIEKLFI